MVETKKELSVKEAAAVAGLSVAYIRRLVSVGRIKGRQLGGHYWIVDGTDLRRWLAERKESGR